MRKIYSSQQIKSIDQLAAQYLQINSFELMQKAGASIYTYVQHETEILVVAGAVSYTHLTLPTNREV